MLETVTFDLKEAASSLKLFKFEAENLLDLVFSRLILRALTPHSLRLKSLSSTDRSILCFLSNTTSNI